MSSGREVVGAATTAPVTSEVIALMTRRDVWTSSRYSPLYLLRPDHSRHQASVRASAESASSTAGVGSNEGCQSSVNLSRAPSTEVKRAVTVPFAISSDLGVLSRNASGPATTAAPSGVGSTQGVIDA